MDGVLGYMTLFSGNFAPQDWVFCDGQQLSISGNELLYVIVRDYFGGDQNYFNLPDLRGRFAVGAGQQPGGPDYDLGDVGGVEQVTLTPDMTAHTHPITAQLTIPCNSSAGNLTAPGDNVYGIPGSGNAVYSNTQNGYMAPVGLYMETDAYGSATPTPIPARAAGLAINYIICVSGPYPDFNSGEETNKGI